MKLESALRASIAASLGIIAACTDPVRPLSDNLAGNSAPRSSTTCSSSLVPSFSGFTWTSTMQVGYDASQGQTRWNPDFACVDGNGQLHLTIGRARNGDSLFDGANLTVLAMDDGNVVPARLGYGTYEYSLAPLPADLDRNAVIGLFSYGGPSGANELDVEITNAWGERATDLPTWLHYSVWPANIMVDHGDGGIDRTVSLSDLGVPTRHVYSWTSNHVTFTSATQNGGPIAGWDTDARPLPQGHVVPQAPMTVSTQMWMAFDDNKAPRFRHDLAPCNQGEHRNPQGKIVGRLQACSLITIVVTGLKLPVPIDAQSGDLQSAWPNSELPLPIVAFVHDAVGHAMPGVTVDLTVSGGGSLSATSGVTDENGLVQAKWTIGASGEQVVEARVRNGTLAAARFTATVLTRQLLLQDDFSHGLGNWVVKDPDNLASWITENDELIGDYNIGCGSRQCSQTDLVLADHLKPPAGVNWRMEIQSGLIEAYCCYNGGAMANLAKVGVWVSNEERDFIEVGDLWQGESAPESWASGYFYHQADHPITIGGSAALALPTWHPAEWQYVALERHGNTYTLYWNDQEVYSFTRSYSQPPTIGFHTYGRVRLDNFKLYRIP
jgi:hypothetical protein